MPYPKEYLIYCSIYNKNPSGDNPMGGFNVWLSNKKKEYNLKERKEDFLTWLDKLIPQPNPLSKLKPKEEDNSEGDK